MGENSVKESILGELDGEYLRFIEDVCLSNAIDFVRLHRADADNLKYVQHKATCYDKCKFGIMQEAVLTSEILGVGKNEF